MSDFRGLTSASGPSSPTTVRRVVQLVDLHSESANDTRSERKVQQQQQGVVADDDDDEAGGRRVSCETTIMPGEVDPGSDFRLAWLMVEGWRAKLRKAGDFVERARWEWKLDDLLAESRARRASIPDIVAVVPSSMKGSVKSGGNRNAPPSRSQYGGSVKSVRWRDRT